MRKPINRINKNNNAYRLIDFIGKDDNYICNSNNDNILVNYESLINNIDLLKHILEIKNVSQINCTDYRCAIIIEKEIKNNCIPIFLVDDYKNKNRSYINLDFFKTHHISIPLSYVMWNVDIKESVNIAKFCNKNNRNMYNLNGDNSLSKDTLLKVKEIIQSMKIPKNDIQKCLLISNYIQSKVQYIDGTETNANGKIYVVDKQLINQECDYIDQVIFNHYGTCMSIANTTTLLLNNPWMNINIRSIYGSIHVWNIVEIDDELYYIDNTWNITKNPNQLPNSLKASKFSDQYFLYGKETNNQLDYHQSDCYIPGIVSDEDYDKNRIKKELKKIKRKSPLNYGDYLPVDSRIK